MPLRRKHNEPIGTSITIPLQLHPIECLFVGNLLEQICLNKSKTLHDHMVYLSAYNIGQQPCYTATPEKEHSCVPFWGPKCLNMSPFCFILFWHISILL